MPIATAFVAILADTGVSHGLIGPREVPRLWDRHVLNCAVIEDAFPSGARVIDVGSGAGLPGLALAITRSDLDVHLVEPMLRRTKWLSETVAALHLDNVTVHRGRAEEFAGVLSAPWATARAVARLDKLARWCVPLLADRGTLVAMKFEMSLLESKLDTQPAQARERARNVGRMVDDAIATVGRVTRELRPGILKDFGLAAAIESQGEDFAQRTGITCNILCTDHDLDPDYDTALAFFRIFQEALTNVSKHARGTQVDVRLMQEGDEAVLEITDDGCGIGAADLLKPRSFGLRGIRERMSSLGGTLELSPVAPHGTRLVLRAPLRPGHPEDPQNTTRSTPA